MKKGLVLLLYVLASFLAPVMTAQAAEPAAAEQKPAEPADTPLGPGWLSLDCCVGVLDGKIADGKGALEKALGISISGYLDAGWTFSTNHPNNPKVISGRYFDQDQNKVVFNNFNLTLDKPEKDWGVGFHLAGDFGRTAELLREATFWGRTLRKEPSAELREAFMTTTIPVGEGIGIKGGLFVTPLGTEIIPNPGAFNDNISRSFLFNFAIPLRHLGVMLSYPLLKTVALSAGVVTGWDNPRDNNHTPSFLGGVTLTPTDQITIASNIIVGEEPLPLQISNPSAQNTARTTWSTVGTFKPIDPLALSLEFTYGHQGSAALSGGNANWYGLASIASYSWTDRFTTALRGEWFNDHDGARLGGDASGKANVNVGEFTLTGAYKFTKMLLGRIELRQDFASGNIFNVGDFNNRGSNPKNDSQTTFGIQLIYQF